MGGVVKKPQAKPATPAVALSKKTPDWPDVVFLSNVRQKKVTLRDCHTALTLTKGRIAQAAVTLDVNLVELQRLVDATPVLFEVAYLHRELLLDECEESVGTAVREDPNLAMEVLKRAGKRRGWGDRDVQAPQKITIEFVKDWRGDRSLPEAENAVVEATIITESEPSDSDAIVDEGPLR